MSEKLSKAELRVLKCVLEGKNNEEITKELFVCLSTVRTHVRRIYKKFGIKGDAHTKRSRLIAAGKLTGMLAAPEFEELE